MTRFFFAPLLVLAIAPPSFAQDMPLSQILIDGEGWKKVEGKLEKPKEIKIRAGVVVGDTAHYQISLPSGEMFQVTSLPGVPLPQKGNNIVPAGWDNPAAVLLTPDGGTLYIAGKAQQSLWAYRVEKDGTVAIRAPYAPLRRKRGEHTIAVTGLTTDADRRIYAATEIGVQVFDPTGRLCGVLTPAAEGKPEHVAFEGDTLTHWIGNVKYARRLNTTGAK